ncbi:hypothetical protein MLD38_029599 [Melastoma candidum]|uniref:Uncharacterized protein n=1 Tax=Melastoma candidum TaxID=119954 RepID=A0ACB9N4F5_9MYRT|nr:hypothetical protein MLD38_029599 [Melastoma candidum]
MLSPRLFRRSFGTGTSVTSTSELRLRFIPLSDSVPLFLLPYRFLESRLSSLLAADDANPLSFRRLKQLHAVLFRVQLHRSSFLVSKLVRSLTLLSSTPHDYPLLVLRHVPFPNAFLYTSLIRHYLLRGSTELSVDIYRRMRQDDVTPLSFTFTAVFKACSSAPGLPLGAQFHSQAIIFGGFDSDLYVGNSLIDMYVKSGIFDCARRVFDEMPLRDVISWTTLIAAYTKAGDMGSAEGLFQSFPEKDEVAWTAMVTGYAQNASPYKALTLFEEMHELGIAVDWVTIVGVVSACAQLGVVKYANWVRRISEELGCGPGDNVVVGSGMIDMYSKCGNVEEAYRVFELMRERNVFTYSSMIAGFAMHGRANLALDLFEKMVNNTDIKPNKVTFIGVLTACSHGGMIEKGKKLFASMKDVYDVVPDADHYTCMIDMFGRAGHLDEALRLAETMTAKPHGGVWGAILGACRIHKNPDVASIVARHLFELEPDNVGNYILLSNIYSSSGRWDEVSELRKLMRERKMSKKPGYSWFETKKGEVHEFVAGDMSHPMYEEIRRILKELLSRLKAAGYKPILSSVVYDLCDSDKERILMGHSEKLAFAFGLASTSDGDPIKIVKNLRICEDCHSFMSVASAVTGREIIVRDNMRFHHFRGGSCSCGNFW